MPYTKDTTTPAINPTETILSILGAVVQSLDIPTLASLLTEDQRKALPFYLSPELGSQEAIEVFCENNCINLGDLFDHIESRVSYTEMIGAYFSVEPFSEALRECGYQLADVEGEE